jgi:eukaryotic-like serine/threonine-protein kinase
MILERGTLLNNRYRIVEILGQGGMGSVYRAIDENLGVEVAVKDNLFTTEDYARQFRREAIILANLRHANLPRVTDHFVINGQGQYLVMDYIEGEDLRQRMERVGAVPEEEVITIGAAVCDALTYLSSRKPSIIHRDIKPGNVKITPQGHIYLVDFGLAKTMQSSQATTTGARAMTPGFSPPEQYGTARTDHRSDIFSLGATLYASLTGATPEDALARAMEQAVLTPIRKHNSKVSRKLAAAIERALEIRPDDRYQSADEFKQALFAASTDNRRRNEDYFVAPPPDEERSIPEDEDLPRPAVEVKSPISPARLISPAGASAASESQQPAAISTLMDEVELKSKPRKRSSKKRGRGCLIAFLVVFVVALIAGLGIYFYYPQLPSLAVARLWPLIFSPITTPTATITEDVSVTPAVTQEIFSPTPTLTMTLVNTDKPPIPTNTQIPPTETPQPTDTPTSVPTPLGGVGKLAFASDISGTPQIYLINTDGTGLRKVTDISEGACQPSWSPDGARIVFTSPCEGNVDYYHKSSLYIINIDGSGLLPLPTVAGGDFDPAWSPDGKYIAFTSIRNNGRQQVYVIKLEDSSVQPLSDHLYVDMQPSWSWDGKKIIFISTRRGTSQVWVMDANGENQELFSRSFQLIDTDPSWSPDGQQVLFTQVVAEGGIPRVMIAAYIFDPEKYNEYRVTKEPIPMREAVFSPDGYWIAFEGWLVGGSHDIYIVAASGAGKQAVTGTEGYDFDAAWCPVIIP